MRVALMYENLPAAEKALAYLQQIQMLPTSEILDPLTMFYYKIKNNDKLEYIFGLYQKLKIDPGTWHNICCLADPRLNYVCLSTCLSVYLSICLSIYLSTCLSTCLSVCCLLFLGYGALTAMTESAALAGNFSKALQAKNRIYKLGARKNPLIRTYQILLSTLLQKNKASSAEKCVITLWSFTFKQHSFWSCLCIN